MIWYEQIEEPIRPFVKVLRDNGINTTCSCGHEMYIEVDLIPDGTLQVIDRVLFEYLAKNDMAIKYTIIIRRERDIAGLTRCFAHIQLGEKCQEKSK